LTTPPLKILITGGAGFIGSAVVRYLIQRTSASVLNVDKLTYAGNVLNLEEVAHSPRYGFLQADIANGAALAEAFAGFQPTHVLHLAAESHVDRSIDGAADFIHTNIVGTYQLLEAARQYWRQLPQARAEAFRFVHVSTDEVYGELPLDSPQAFTETTPYAPQNPYSASKASADHLVRAWHHTYGLPTIISNCANNYGPYQYPEKLIPLVILNALAGKPLPVYGNGEQVRDWLHVNDHASALYTLLLKGQVGDTYNIGAHNERKNIDVVKRICALLDELQPQSTPYARLITFVEDRPGHDKRYAIDASKISRELGWRPQYSFAAGLRETVKWYTENRHWCEMVG